jgi:XRE family transcriptional regulator, regulator of sulfur utilization
VGTKFSEYVRDVEQRSTPEELAELETFRERYRVANQLLGLRHARGLTQVALAEASGVPQSEVSRLERGAGNPTEHTMTRLAHALGAHWELVPDEATAGAPLDATTVG